MDKQHLRSYRAQAAMEFILLIGLLILIFIIVLAVISGKLHDISEKKEEIQIEDVALKIQKEVNIASKVLDGYKRTFYLPQKIDEKDYEIIVSGNEVIVRLDNFDGWVLIPSIQGNINIGFNTINKTGGVIYLS